MAAARSYKELVKALYKNNALFPQVKLGLDNSHALHAALGSPASGLRIVHVAGTNGKGSVSWKVARALSSHGYSCGLFVSPHLACFRERIQVNGELIPEAAVERLLPHVISTAQQHSIPATFFEIVTHMAFLHYADRGVDFVALETGLGGRLDSTNIVVPEVSVITSVSLDHTRVLGDTVEAIAKEKAGIIKPGVPVILGPHALPHVIEPIAKALGSPVIQVPPQTAATSSSSSSSSSGEDGATAYEDYDAENSAVAEAALGCLKTPKPLEQDLLRRALRSRPPCRFEVLRCSVATSSSSDKEVLGKVTVVLDVAHNGAALERLFARLRHQFPGAPLRLVLSFARDKLDAGVVPIVAAQAEGKRLHLVQSASSRAVDVGELAQALAGAGASVPPAQVHPVGAYGESPTAGIQGALLAALGAQSAAPVGSKVTSVRVRDSTVEQLRAGGRGEVVVVCGSAYLMAEARQALGFDEPRDDPETVLEAQHK